jgi:DNA-directed RNA polymerase specialized sigma24 family protein
MPYPRQSTSEICDSLRPALREYLVAETRDVTLADDLTRQTILRMQFGAFACREEEVLPWAFGIARRLVLAAQRRSARVAH